VRTAEVVSRDLALREEARRFFELVDSRPEDKVVVDFEGVRSISRSFAHKCTVRKTFSNKNIREINLPLNISKMQEIVKAPKHPQRWLTPPTELNTTALEI